MWGKPLQSPPQPFKKVYCFCFELDVNPSVTAYAAPPKQLLAIAGRLRLPFCTGEVAAAGSREGCDFLILFKLEPTLQSLVAFQSIGVRRTVWARDLAARPTGFAINLSVAAGAIGHLGAIHIPFAVAIIAGFKAIAVASPSYAAANTAFVNAFSITQRARVLAFAVASTTLKMLFSIAIRASNLLGVTTNCAIINTGCEQKQHTKCHC